MKLMVIFNDIYIEGKDIRGSGYQMIRGRNLNAW